MAFLPYFLHFCKANLVHYLHFSKAFPPYFYTFLIFIPFFIHSCYFWQCTCELFAVFAVYDID